MSFGQSATHVFGNYVTFQGRASRSEFWWFFLFQVIVLVIASVLGDIVNLLVSLALLLPALAVGARRLHDVGRSGWWQLLVLTGIGVLLLIFWWVQPSSD